MAKKRRKGMTAKQFERGVRKLVRPRKQSGNRASSIAAKLLRHAKGAPSDYQQIEFTVFGCSPDELRTLAASVLSQDETKGPRR
jgi:hypothetical protein